MPARKKTTKASRSRKATKHVASEIEFDEMQPALGAEPQTPVFTPNRKPSFLKLAAVVLLLVIVGALLYRNRSMFIAATVNGQPILRSELNKRLTDRFGSQTLEAMIGERLVTAAAKKEGVQASQDEIKAKIAEVEQGLQGQMKLDDALALQGISRKEFESQIEIQIIIDKMLGKDVSVSAQEVDEYITVNKDNLTSSDSAKQKEEAAAQIKNNKISQKFQEWFTKLKEEAKISRFIATP